MPRVLGIDDFALRRSRSYATVLIDAEAGPRVDVVPGRTADAAEKRLLDHPGVEIVCRGWLCRHRGHCSGSRFHWQHGGHSV